MLSGGYRDARHHSCFIAIVLDSEILVIGASIKDVRNPRRACQNTWVNTPHPAPILIPAPVNPPRPLPR